MPHARAALPYFFSRLLIVAGAALACWLLGFVLATAAHASDSATDSGTAEPSKLVEDDAAEPRTADHTAHLLSTRSQEPSSGPLGNVTDSALSTVGDTVTDTVDGAATTLARVTDSLHDSGEAATDVVDDASDATGLDGVVPVDPGGDSESDSQRQAPTHRPDTATSPQSRVGATASDAPARTGPAPEGPRDRDQSQDQEATQRDERTSRASQSQQPQRRGESRLGGQQDNRREASTHSAADAHDTTPQPTAPTTPQRPCVPAGPTPSMTQVQDGSNGGRHPCVLSSAPPRTTHLELLATNRDRAADDASGDPALPYASPG